MVLDGIKSKGNLKRWERHLELKRREPPSPKDVIEFIKEIEISNLKVAAYLSVLILTACRSNELLHYKYFWVKNPKLRDGSRKYKLDWETYRRLRDEGQAKIIEKPGLRKFDVEVVERKGKEWVKFSVRNQKRKKVDQTIYRSVLIPLDEDYYLSYLLDVFNKYWDSLKLDDALDSKEVFDFSSEYVGHYLSKHYGINIHIWRHYRCKWLVDEKYEHLNSYQLQKFIGWDDLNMSVIYAEASEENIAAAFEKSIKNE